MARAGEKPRANGHTPESKPAPEPAAQPQTWGESIQSFCTAFAKGVVEACSFWGRMIKLTFTGQCAIAKAEVGQRMQDNCDRGIRNPYWPYAMLPMLCTARAVEGVQWLFTCCSRRDLVGSASQHEAKVKRIQAQFQSRGKGLVATSRPWWERISSRVPVDGEKPRQGVDTSDLTQVVSADLDALTIAVEPRTKIADLSKWLLPLGYTVPVVPELDELTVGGLLMGCGIESSSFKYGMFDALCTEYEILDAKGQVLRVTEQSDKDLFYALPWSYGSLGLLLSATLKITRCKTYVSLECTRFADMAALQAAMEAACQDRDNEFVEALAYAPDDAVLTVGKYADEAPAQSQFHQLYRWHSAWWYRLVHECGEDQPRIHLPSYDYLHRHSKSIFWEVSYLFPYGHTSVMRWLFGWLTPPSVKLLKSCQPAMSLKSYMKAHIVQDYLLPLADLKEMLDVGEEHINVFPIWICPYLHIGRDKGGLHCAKGKDVMYVDVGYYGLPDGGATACAGLGASRPCRQAAIEGLDMDMALKPCEDFLMTKKGYVMLYAYHTLSQEEFEAMFDHTHYRAMRARTGADGVFPEVWDKVKCR